MILRMLLLLCVFGAGWWRMERAFCHQQHLEARLPADGETVRLEGHVVQLEEKESWHVLTLDTEKWERVLVYVEKEKEEGNEKEKEKENRNENKNKNKNKNAGWRIGQQVLAKGQVSRFAEAGNPGQFDLSRYYRSKGISMTVFADQVSGDEGSWPYQNGLYQIRRRLSGVMEAICAPEDLGIFQAAILGEKGTMDEDIRDLYQKSGISHLLAISGLHLSLIGMGFYRLLRRGGLGFGAAGAAGAAAVISYGIMTGASGSAVRAVIMLSVSFLASWLGRTYDLLSALSLAALLLSASNPFVIGESGFQLSFGAVFGIGFVGERLRKGLRPKGGLRESFLTSLGIQLVTGPIVLWHYYTYPVYGIFLNLLVIPLMGYVIVSGILGMGVGLFSAALGRLAVGSGHYILLLYQWLCLLFLKLPGSQLITGRPQPVQIFWYGAAVTGLLAIISCGREGVGKWMSAQKKRGDEREENPEKPGVRGLRWAVFLTGTVLCFLLLLPSRQEGLTVCFLDVGQGDGAVIRGDGGEIVFSGLSGEGGEIVEPLGSRGITLLVDGGSTSDKNVGENRLEPYLKYSGISAVDVIMVSHGDADHINGLSYLLKECEEIEAGCLVLPEAGKGDEAYVELIWAAEARGMPVRYMDGGDRIKAGALELTCLYPGPGEELLSQDRNRQSLVVKGDYEGFHFLLTGDTSQECESRILERAQGEVKDFLGEVQVLKAAHHGSRYSSSEAFLEAVSPQITVLSYGEGNRYGHPHEEAVERILEAGSRILETENQGAVTFHIQDGRVIYGGYKAVYIENSP